MGTPFNLTIMTVSSAFGASTTIPLNAAAIVGGVNFLSFASAGATGGAVVDYSILDAGNSEIGTATYTSSNTTLTSRTPTKSTNGNAAIVATSAALIYGAVRAESLTPYITQGQLLGTATNDSASTGNVGEFVSAQRLKASAVALTTALVSNVTSIPVTIGDWDIFGVAGFTGTATAASLVSAWTTSSNTLPGIDSAAEVAASGPLNLSTVDSALGVPTYRFSSSASQTIYLNSLAIFTVGTASAFGTVAARRAR